MWEYLQFILNWKLIKCRLNKGIAALFASIGIFRTVEWMIAKALKAFNVADAINWALLYRIAIGLAVLKGLWTLLPRRSIYGKISGTDISIHCKICDLLMQKGDIAISVNDTFDTTFEKDFVSPNSLQGKFQLKYYGWGKLSILNEQIKDKLSREVTYKTLKDRNDTNTRRYSPGTTIKLDVGTRWNVGGRKHAYLLALSQSTSYGSASTTEDNFYSAIQCFWDRIREIGHKEKLNVPVIGTGRSGLQKDRMKIIKDIIYSFVTASRNYKGVIVPELVICISPGDAIKYKIDLDDLEKFIYVHCNNNSIFTVDGTSSSSAINGS